MAVDDHGLEVLKKSAELYAGPTELLLRVKDPASITVLSSLLATVDASSSTIDGISYLNLLSEWPFLAVDNNIKANYPTATRETYEFRKDLVVVITLQVDYTDSTKDVLSEVRRIV